MAVRIGILVDGVIVPSEWTHPAERKVYANAINSGLAREDAAWIAAMVRAARARAQDKEPDHGG